MAWYNSNWTKRTVITIDHTKVVSTLTNFPVCLDITDSSLDLWDNALSSGDDILFTSDDGTTKLSHELSKYDNSSKELIVYVEVPTLSSTTDTVLYMYYGNPSASAQEDVAGTWDSNGFVGVWHFEGNANASKGTNGVVTGTVNYTTGLIGQAAYVTANSNYIDVTDSNLAFASQDFTWRTYVKTGSDISTSQLIIDNASDLLEIRNSKFCTNMLNIGFTYHDTILSTNTWYMLCLSCDDSESKSYMYVNTTKKVISSGAKDFQNTHRILENLNPGYRFMGYITEERVNSILLSDAWLETEYNNIMDNSNFFSIGEVGLFSTIRRRNRNDVKNYKLRRRLFVGG